MSEILNDLHVMQVKKEKGRLAKSMIDDKINTYMDGNNESEEEDGYDLEEKQRQFIDAHYLNRRKSC